MAVHKAGVRNVSRFGSLLPQLVPTLQLCKPSLVQFRTGGFPGQSVSHLYIPFFLCRAILRVLYSLRKYFDNISGRDSFHARAKVPD